MARIVIGAGVGWFLGLFVVALNQNASFLTDAALFRFSVPQPFNFGYSAVVLASLTAGAIMGWAWQLIATECQCKDD